VRSLRLGGLSATYILRVGIAAVIFILLFKWLAPKLRIAPLAQVAAAV
jgi:hypothetical protein